MASGLKANTSGAKAILGAIRSQATKANESLTQNWPPADQAIHDARKRIKKARAGLRLLRAGMSAREYRRENESLRDAGRLLSPVRDSKTTTGE